MVAVQAGLSRSLFKMEHIAKARRQHCLSLPRSVSQAARRGSLPTQGGRRRRSSGLSVEVKAGNVAETFEIKGVLESLCEKEDLTFEDAKQALSFLVDEGDPAKISAFLVLLRAKGETAMEVAGLASAMQDKMSTVKGKVLVLVHVGFFSFFRFLLMNSSSFFSSSLFLLCFGLPFCFHLCLRGVFS